MSTAEAKSYLICRLHSNENQLNTIVRWHTVINGNHNRQEKVQAVKINTGLITSAQIRKSRDYVYGIS